MFPAVCDKLLTTNTLIVGDRNCGKTTFLKQVIHYAIDCGYKIIVFDSATEHIDKSILMYCKKLFNNYLEIHSPEKEQIVDVFEEGMYPFDIVKESNSKQFYLFDVSRYLEEGYLYEENSIMRQTNRMLYKHLVLQCLDVMYELLHHIKSIVIMDEIELLPLFYQIIKKYNDNNIFFIDCLHSDDSCSDELRQLFDINRVSIPYISVLDKTFVKPEDMLCGPACLHYLLNLNKKMNVHIPKRLVWITDIANLLSELQIAHQLSCFDSTLYTDYENKRIPKNHPACISIDKYIAKKNNILVKKFTSNDVIYNKLPDTYFISSVRSNYIDKAMPNDSFHYILVHQSMDKFDIICPQKTDYCIKSMELDTLVEMINMSGNWILNIKL